MIFPDESYRIMGACFEVHNQLGCASSRLCIKKL
jgi:hypothetical protein